MEQGKIMEAEVPTVQVGATPTGLSMPPLPQPPKVFLQTGCPSCHPTNSVKALKAHWYERLQQNSGRLLANKFTKQMLTDFGGSFMYGVDNVLPCESV